MQDLGELSGPDRDRIVGASHAMLMPGTWPEPFGLAVIEALACGTPVLARRVGALPEILRDGVDGFFGDDVDHLAFLVDRVGELDRERIRASVVDPKGVDGAALVAADTRRAPVAVGPGWEIPAPAPLPGLDAGDAAFPEVGGGPRTARIEPLPRPAERTARH